jgi:poly(3-hydroxybutyrate) depolymerase
MTQASAALKRTSRVRTTRQAAKAIEAAGHAADLLAWRQERAARIREVEQARLAVIAARETAIEEATVAYLVAVQARQRIMADAQAKCAEHDQAAAAAVAGLRGAGLSRADIAQVTGASTREVASILAGTTGEQDTDAHTGDEDGPGRGGGGAVDDELGAGSTAVATPSPQPARSVTARVSGGCNVQSASGAAGRAPTQVGRGAAAS